MKDLPLKAVILCSVLMAPTFVLAQTTTDTGTAASVAAEDPAGLMTPEELQTLVGPIALYPDTLLIQVLVAATFPLEVMKADRLLEDNATTPPDELKTQIDAQGWDESVAVLAAAFPDVLNEMAVHVDWTETMGNAMLAQSDDVMDAVQVMREMANEAGTLVSGEEQTVEVTQDNSGDQTIIIQPTDPEVVYVPQYDSNVVYVQDSNSTSDAVAAGLVAFGTFVVMDAIFNNNDPWNNYWGCRNCGGWGGRPIVRNPRNVNINGNVNIGNNVGYKPNDRRKKQARNDIQRKRGPDGKAKVPVNRPDRGDQMRSNLSRKSGAADISRDKAPRAAVDRSRQAGNKAGTRPAANRPATNRPAGNKPASRPAGNHNAAVARTGAPSKAKAQARKPSTARAPSPKPSRSKAGGAMNHRSSAPKARSGGSRGRSSGGGRRR